MPLYINYPSWIHPEIFPGLPVLGFVRWYGLMYVFSFGTAFLVYKNQVREGLLDENGKRPSDDDIVNFFTFSILLLLVGARIFSTLIYDSSGYYWRKPWRIFWPFDEKGHFTGLVGMSYHGGFCGGMLGMIIWCRRHKVNTVRWIEAMGAAIPLGYTFGRLGNFFNGELFGRITTMPWGMVFPAAQKFPATLDWVREFAAKAGMEIPAGAIMVNLPRHPSQLYEAFFEGILLWAISYYVRHHKPFDGFFFFVYIFGYGFVRFFIEYFREPDADLGFRIGDTSAPIYLNSSLLNFSTGQIFCALMMLAGLLLLAIFWLRSRKGRG